MEILGTIGGGAPVMKRYLVGESFSSAGIPAISTTVGSTANHGGFCLPMEVTGTALLQGNVGLAVDTATYAAVVTETTDAIVTVAVNPDLIIRAKMSGGAAEDTAMTIITEDGTASATGIIITGFTSVDGEAVWGYDGNNKGILRKFDDTSGGVDVSFPNAIAGGDRFLQCSSSPCMTLAAANPFVDITTNLTQADASTVASGDGDGFIIMDLQTGTEDDDGENNSFYHFIQNRHIFGAAALTN